jgi:hypothetical protein
MGVAVDRTQDGTCAVRLRSGVSFLIDEADLPRLSGWWWSAINHGKGRFTVRGERIVGGVRTRVALHRFLLQAPEGVLVDHVNGDPLDNRRANLRLCNWTENARNRGPRKSSSTRLKGVSKFARGFRSTIVVEGRRIYLGAFSDPVEAAKAYDRAARRLYGEFARPNFPAEAL